MKLEHVKVEGVSQIYRDFYIFKKTNWKLEIVFMSWQKDLSGFKGYNLIYIYIYNISIRVFLKYVTIFEIYNVLAVWGSKVQKWTFAYFDFEPPKKENI